MLRLINHSYVFLPSEGPTQVTELLPLFPTEYFPCGLAACLDLQLHLVSQSDSVHNPPVAGEQGTASQKASMFSALMEQVKLAKDEGQEQG